MRKVSNSDYDLLVSALPDVCAAAMRCGGGLRAFNRARRLLLLAVRLKNKRGRSA